MEVWFMIESRSSWWYWYGRGTHMCRTSWEVWYSWFVMIDTEVLYSPTFSQAINLHFSRKLTDLKHFSRESNGHVHNMWALFCCEKFIAQNVKILPVKIILIVIIITTIYINFSEIAISFKILLGKCIRLS